MNFFPTANVTWHNNNGTWTGVCSPEFSEVPLEELPTGYSVVEGYSGHQCGSPGSVDTVTWDESTCGGLECSAFWSGAVSYSTDNVEPGQAVVIQGSELNVGMTIGVILGSLVGVVLLVVAVLKYRRMKKGADFHDGGFDDHLVGQGGGTQMTSLDAKAINDPVHFMEDAELGGTASPWADPSSQL